MSSSSMWTLLQVSPRISPHGAGKGQVHGDVELAIRAAVQGLADDLSGPDVPLLVLRFWQHHIVEGVLWDDLPSDRLLEGAAEQFDDLLNVLIAHVLRLGAVGLGGHRRRFLQGLNVLVHYTGRDVLHLQIPDDGVNIVGDEGGLAVVHGHAPPLFAVEGDEVQHELLDGLVAGREEGARGLFALNLRLALQCLLVSSCYLPLCLAFFFSCRMAN